MDDEDIETEWEENEETLFITEEEIKSADDKTLLGFLEVERLSMVCLMQVVREALKRLSKDKSNEPLA